MRKENSEGRPRGFLIEERDQRREVKDIGSAQGIAEVGQTIPRGDLRAIGHGLGDCFHDVRTVRVWLW